ncbi:GvpL/GvpF family gas vesicle protein [Cognatiyoonia sp. IB215446]|uniref:GvpL/GvpF family gas vesicle protein n=1 Tax=Cognatiyoonia sp. IB215446 TaxID=3097355 RepID=UPI002A0E9737|nr:GvpL/GvpF family gas vesicle protein [Cognatiyoonia sp. IB215446]MDX8348467.1 GvpL/GvpF family gas vesicle protein [Cognatiyoonia sp. IB215446]
MTLLQLHGLVPSTSARNADAPAHRLFRCDSLGALVSGLCADFDFDNPDDLESYAKLHHNILLAYCAQGPVLPMAIGSVFSSEHALSAALAQRQPEHLRALDAISKMGEYAVQVVPKEQFVSSNHVPLTGREFLRARKVKRDERRDLKVRQIVFTRDLMAQLQKLSLKECPATAKPGRLLDQTILIGNDAVSKLRELATVSHQSACDLSLEFKVTGPWPPYSFDPSDVSVMESRSAG